MAEIIQFAKLETFLAELTEKRPYQTIRLMQRASTYTGDHGIQTVTAYLVATTLLPDGIAVWAMIVGEFQEIAGQPFGTPTRQIVGERANQLLISLAARLSAREYALSLGSSYAIDGDAWKIAGDTDLINTEG